MKKYLGEKHIVVDSTQNLMRERIKEKSDLPHCYFVIAEEQTSGRGRSDHLWSSVAGNLHVSILITELPILQITWVPLWVSVCVHRALVDLGIDPLLIQLKWPNDLWTLRSKKIAGILCEKISNVVIAGIGLNLKHAPELSSDVVPGGESLSADQVLEKIIEQMNLPTSVSIIREYYDQYGMFKSGELVTWNASQDQRVIQGVVIGLGAFGELLVKSNEESISLYSEDVQRVRLV